MHVRLAFTMTANLASDILIAGEVPKANSSLMDDVTQEHLYTYAGSMFFPTVSSYASFWSPPKSAFQTVLHNRLGEYGGIKVVDSVGHRALVMEHN